MPASFLVWICLLCVLASPACAAPMVNGPADLARLSATADSAALLAALDDVSLRDGAQERFTPFDAAVLHRFRVSGTLRGRTPPMRVETQVYADRGRLTFGLTLGQIDRARVTLEPELGPDHLHRMGMVAQSWVARGTGVSGVVELEATVQLSLGALRFRTPVAYKVSEGGGVRPVTLRPPDAMRCAAAALGHPLFRLLEPRARRTSDALAINASGDRAEIPLQWEAKLGQGSALQLGGVLRVDLASGRATMPDATLPIADLGRAGIPEIVALAARPDVQWVAANAAATAAFVHLVARPAGWLVALETGRGERLDLAVGEAVQVLSSSLPAAALPDPERRADAELRGFLAQAVSVRDAADLGPMAVAYPGVLLVEVSAGEVAAAKGDREAMRRHAQAARTSADAVVSHWSRAREDAQNGELASASAHVLAALKLCPTDTRLWAARRRLRLALSLESPDPLPADLPAWRRAPHDAPRLIARLAALESKLGAAAPYAVPSAAPLPANAADSAAAAVQLVPSLRASLQQSLPGWDVASLSHETPSSPADEPRLVATLVPQRRDPALPSLARIQVFPPVASTPSTAQAGETLARLASLRIGSTFLLPRTPPPYPTTTLWIEPLDVDALLPALDAVSLKPVPDGMLEQLGPLRHDVLLQAYRAPITLVSFSVGPVVGGPTTGALVGIDVPALDRTLLTRVQIPGGIVEADGFRDLLSPVFAPEGQPILDRPELALRSGGLELLFVPHHDDDAHFLRALRHRTPFVVLEPGVLRLERAAVVAAGGAVRAQVP